MLSTPGQVSRGRPGSARRALGRPRPTPRPTCDVAGPPATARDVDKVDQNPCPSYADLLEAARALGCADGRSAARWGLADLPGTDRPTCGGRDPERFARLLWGDRPGDPPSGLELNAPLWYTDGFAEALAAERDRADRRRDTAAWSCVRALAVPGGRG